MKMIPLTQEYVAFVDAEDYDRLNQYKWSYSEGYAITWVGGTLVRMHRMLDVHREIREHVVAISKGVR